LKIVLIYASWCGHSKKMLPDFAKIESEFHNKTINGTLVIIEKHTDENKELVKEYGVKGFPTLFSVKNGTRSPLNERTYEGLKNHIESNA
jgi:thiol-disulfide isomerase/thioredoxin